MNTKPNKKTCYSRAVVGINLTTDERRQWPSVKTAAEGCGMQASWFTHLLRGHQPANGWLCAYEDEQDWFAERLDYFKRSGKFKRTDPSKDKSMKGKVALRIDSRTVIYVTPDKATPEYAQQYLNKIKGIKDEQD